MTMSLLEMKNVSYTYEGTSKKVLNHVDIEFKTGKVYAIVGKSGSGKTTLLSLISGLDVCREGDIYYKGNSLKEMDRDHYRPNEIGVIFQSYNLLLNATAVENIVLSMNISKVDVKNKKQVAYELLQSVGIARAISHKPNVIIADEPTGNLDTENETAIINIFKTLAQQEGKCVILVTHSRKISGYADEVWGINDGKLLYVK